MNSTKFWIALDQTRGIGPAHMKEIHGALKKIRLSLSDLIGLTESEIRNEFHFPEKIAAAISNVTSILPAIEEDYFRLLDSGMSVIPFYSELYPARLHDLLGSGQPPLLYGYGNVKLLGRNGVAILGDRDVSDRGEQIAFEAAREVTRHDYTVIGGFARGAGLIAHRAALVSGGTTIAVVPYGMFHFNIPPLLSDIFNPDAMLVVSPFYPTREANQYNAFIRNRIICAASRAVYIVEAPPEGGIFEAAKSAHNLGVPLFVTEYAEYPKNAGGNRKIMDELGGIPVLGRIENELLVPNMDRIIGSVKFGTVT